MRLRLGFRQVKGIRQEDMDILIAKQNKSFTLCRRSAKDRRIRKCIGKTCRCRCISFYWVWIAGRLCGKYLQKTEISLYTKDNLQPMYQRKILHLPQMKISEHVVHDYACTSLIFKGSPRKFCSGKTFIASVFYLQGN